GAHQRQSGFFLVLSLCSFLAALLASEAALFLSGMFFLLYRFSDKTFAPRFVQTLGVASVLVAYFGIRWLATGRIVEPGFPEIWTKGFWEWVSAAGFLIKLTVFPYPQQIFLSSIPVTFAHAVWGLLGVVFLLGAFMLALKKKEVLMGFGAGWTLLFLIPAVFSIIIAPDGTGRPVERAGYLMSFGVLMLAGSVLGVIVEKGSSLPGRLPVLRAALTGFMLSVLVVFWGVDSWGRNLTWLNSYSFWSAAESAAPQSGHPRRELGKLFARADVPEKAGPLFVKAVEADEKRLGENHPELAESLYELGRFYAAQKKYTEAEPLFVRALTIKEEWGFSHTLRTASLLYDLAELYRLNHAPLETEEFYQTSLRIREEKLGSGHPDVAMVLKGLGGLYHTQERYSEAEKLYGRAINIQTQVYGKEHPFTGFTRYNLAKVYHAMERYEEAENLYKELLPGLERLFFAENPLVIETLENLASIYEIKKQDEKLEEVYGKLYDIREKTLEGSDPNLKIIFEKYSKVLLRNSKEEEARAVTARYNALNKSG
ncbi:MAG TPA: tetratricopeptide repeat protein, partial [Nitrospiria bacterium]|nr:tetratricopeptide repeat protein [Nitrospiria bacterium]